MARIKIKDIPEDQKISVEDMQAIRGGGRIELSSAAINNYVAQNPGTLGGIAPLPFPIEAIQNPGVISGIAPLPFPHTAVNR